MKTTKKNSKKEQTSTPASESSPVWLEFDGVRAVKLPVLVSETLPLWSAPLAAEIIFDDGERILLPPSQLTEVSDDSIQPDSKGRLRLGLSRLCFEGRGRDGLLEFWRLPESSLVSDAETGPDWNPERVAIAPDRVREIHQAGRLVWSRSPSRSSAS